MQRLIPLIVVCLFASSAEGEGLRYPTEDTLLTVSGLVEITNVGDRAVFDRRMLESLPRSEFRTSTPWTEGESRFEGVLLSDILAAVGATGDRVLALALNDYSASIPRADWTNYRVLIADRRDGDIMPVREKGPLWIIYPLDAHPELKATEVYGRMVWQLRELVVE